MPHQCTACERLFEDGSREMLGGCPGCGGNRFQYLPEGPDADPSASQSTGSTTGNRDPADGPDGDDGDLIVASGSGSGPSAADDASPEGSAQADARTSMVEEDDLPAAPPEEAQESDMDADGPAVEPAPDPPVEELAAELEDAFGSIRIVERGEYELDLMELYESDTCIIQLEEDGRYVIDVPEMFEA